MFILYAVVAGLIVGRLTGGRLERLAEVRFRWAAVAFAGVATQLVLFLPPVATALDDARSLAIALYVGSTALVLLAVFRNIRLTGLPLVALGATLNLAAIVANGGIMPTTAEALTAAGLTADTGFSNGAVVADPALPWLIDRFALPAWMPLANVFSVGDVILGLGIAIAVAAGMHARRADGASAPAARGPVPR